MWTAARRLYGSHPSAWIKRAGLCRNQPPTRGRPEHPKMELDSDRGREKVRSVLGAAATTAQGNRRAGVRNDGLSLRSMRNRLEVEWQAREIHPWDQGLAPERSAQRFVQQCLEDVDAAISRLFATLPDTDEIVLRVLDPASGDPIVTGTVSRAEASAATAGSVGMKLKSLGLVYRLANWQFESLGN